MHPPQHPCGLYIPACHVDLLKPRFFRSMRTSLSPLPHPSHPLRPRASWRHPKPRHFLSPCPSLSLPRIPHRTMAAPLTPRVPETPRSPTTSTPDAIVGFEHICSTLIMGTSKDGRLALRDISNIFNEGCILSPYGTGVSGILQSPCTEDKENNDENKHVDWLHRNDKYVRLFGTSCPTHTMRQEGAILSFLWRSTTLTEPRLGV
ncbi:hypothetical protein GUJ93_ZPchr0011g27479 [Zizania palustris]|uniref:Uncharacterized protein n=1 Tax=Zizania palustris TaxID=103762 RepID=A0A8J5WJ08_ZIZPA|nr:hypothetical protein GUJ93_ZPchr0011g27479 [Zizania palustris]